MLVWRTYSIEIVPYYQTMNEQLSMHSAAILVQIWLQVNTRF